jgi:heme O synthase-like polyprenyltransferase
MGIGMLIYSVFGIVQGLTHIKIMPVAVIVGFVYTTYAVGQFFDKRKTISYVKAFIAYLLGMITFYLAALAIGTIIDLIIQK